MLTIGNVFQFGWELSLLEWLQAHITGAAMAVVSFLSLFGEELLMVAIMGFLYWCYDKRIGRAVGLNLLMVCVWGPMIKNVVLRLRPYFASDKIDLLRKIDSGAEASDVAAQGYSFPSGHSANSVAVYGSIAAYLKKNWLLALAIVLPLLVGFSRMAVGAHYPTDVLAGWALGLLTMLLLSFLSRKIKRRGVLYGLLVLSALPGFFYCTSADYYTSFGMLVGFVCAMPFEEKLVRFETTRNPLRAALRVLGGGALYLALNALLKMPFSSEFLASGTLAANAVRSLRYAVILFAVAGVYPLLFRVTARIGKRRAADAPAEAAAPAEGAER